MISDAVKIARTQEHAAAYQAARDILTNPAVDVILGFILIEYLQGHVVDGQRVAGGGFFGSVAGTALETGLVGYLLMPSFKDVAERIGPLIKSLGPLIAGSV